MAGTSEQCVIPPSAFEQQKKHFARSNRPVFIIHDLRHLFFAHPASPEVPSHGVQPLPLLEGLSVSASAGPGCESQQTGKNATTEQLKEELTESRYTGAGEKEYSQEEAAM
jgi:hypothetical protein